MNHKLIISTLVAIFALNMCAAEITQTTDCNKMLALVEAFAQQVKNVQEYQKHNGCGSECDVDGALNALYNAANEASKACPHLEDQIFALQRQFCDDSQSAD